MQLTQEKWDTACTIGRVEDLAIRYRGEKIAVKKPLLKRLFRL